MKDIEIVNYIKNRLEELEEGHNKFLNRSSSLLCSTNYSQKGYDFWNISYFKVKEELEKILKMIEG